MSAYDTLLEALAAHGSTVRGHGRGAATAQCPAHDDRVASLAVRALEDRVVLHCHAGCLPGDVVAAVNLTMADLFNEPRHDRRTSCAPSRQASPWDEAMAALGFDHWPSIEHVCGRMLYDRHAPPLIDRAAMLPDPVDFVPPAYPRLPDTGSWP